MIIKTLTAAVIAVGTAIVAATPAYAVITPFANFSALAGDTANIRWKNSAANGSSGTGGTYFTVASNGATTPGTRNVRFSFLQLSIAPFVTNAIAAFTLNASAVNTLATVAGITPNQFLIQSVASGSFSFLSTAPITIGTKTFATGSNLLSATFAQSAIFGKRSGSSGSFTASTLGGSTIAYTSDFLDFTATIDRDFALSMTAISSVLQAVPTTGVPTRALRSFRALSTGSFSTEPSPIVTAIPEPATWGLMIVGFGLVGMQSRRRGRNATVTVAA